MTRISLTELKKCSVNIMIKFILKSTKGRRLMKVTLISCLSVLSFSANAQQQNFRYPLDVSPSFSGNYGELRNNHFHGGIDCRVGGVIGAPVFATDSGYVSEISISASGYGNALFITHPNGFTSVYGHLSGYSDRIKKLILERQYAAKRSEIDIELQPNILRVDRGEIVGYAGNSGSSMGPHLHFEIRDTKSNTQLNLFERNFVKVEDNTPPQLTRVLFVGYSEKDGVPVSKPVRMVSTVSTVRNVKGKKTTVLPQSVVMLPQRSYVAIDAIDRMSGTSAKLAVEEYNVYLDNNRIFSLNIGEVPLDKNRYINALIYFPYKAKGGAPLIKSLVEPGNALKDRITAKHSGLIVLNDNNVHQVKVEVLDYKKNVTSRIFNVQKSTGNVEYEVIPDEPDTAPIPLRIGEMNNSVSSECEPGKEMYMEWFLANVYNTKGFEISISPASLYSPILFKADTAAARVNSYAPVWDIGDKTVSLHFPAIVRVKCNIPDSLASKAVFVAVSGRGGLTSVGGTCSDGTMTAKIRNFGRFTVATDTKAPNISTAMRDGAAVRGKEIKFRVSDNLSGIRSYEVLIDDNWVVTSMDAKTATLSVPLQDAKISRGKHKVEVNVVDSCGNSATLNRTFIY
jgi:murein DD-endopeptidase MepM/ murein hydrolase activator NlpD